MASFLSNYNISILAIPAYWFLSTIPHGYAINIATKGQAAKWDNRNPRSSDLKAKLKAKLPAETYAKYERAEACHANGMENLPLFASAVILGNMASLEQRDLNTFVASFLVVRAVYTACYLTNDTQGKSGIRSAVWVIGLGLCFNMIIKAAKALA